MSDHGAIGRAAIAGNIDARATMGNALIAGSSDAMASLMDLRIGREDNLQVMFNLLRENITTAASGTHDAIVMRTASP
ncbi:MAG TPA: hypothetical protein VMX33_05395 [bacterium]|nr:hypothetical protein [bacterium]